jgi:hypothetical protein
LVEKIYTFYISLSTKISDPISPDSIFKPHEAVPKSLDKDRKGEGTW